MHESNEFEGAQAAAAIAAVVVLAFGAPLLGVFMIPVVAIDALARAVVGGASAANTVRLLD